MILWLASVLGFVLMRIAPGRPSDVLRSRQIDPAVARALDVDLGLDRPLYEQYFTWAAAALVGDFGRSAIDRQPVWEKIVERLPATLALALTARLIGLAGVPLGLVAALRQHSRFDVWLRILTSVAAATPHWWLGLLVLLFVAAPTGWFPLGGMDAFGEEASLLARLHHLILPACTLALADLILWSRFVRAATLDVLAQDFVRTARAKGLPGFDVMVRHLLPVVLLPVVPLFGVSVAAVVSGTVIVESVFSWSGIGRLAFTAALQRDYPVVMGLLLLSSAMVLVCALIADIAFAWLDPRVKLG